MGKCRTLSIDAAGGFELGSAHGFGVAVSPTNRAEGEKTTTVTEEGIILQETEHNAACVPSSAVHLKKVGRALWLAASTDDWWIHERCALWTLAGDGCVYLKDQ